MSDSTYFSSIRSFSNNFYVAASEHFAPIRNFLDDAAKKLAVEIHAFVETLDQKLEFQDDSTGKTLQRLWSIIYTPGSSEEQIETTAQSIKKLAFSLMIAIPVAFTIKETIATSNLSLTDANSLSHAGTILTKKILYVGAILYFVNLLLTIMPDPKPSPDSKEKAS